MKKLVAYIFLFIFSFQVLPVKSLGKLLFKNQMTEEIKEDCCSTENEGTLKVKKEADPLLGSDLNDTYTARIEYLSHFLHIVIHEAERLPHQHVADIFTPPPNYCA